MTTRIQLFVAVAASSLAAATLVAQPPALPEVPRGVLLALHFQKDPAAPGTHLAEYSKRSQEVAGIAHLVVGKNAELPTGLKPLPDEEGTLRKKYAPAGDAIVLVDAAGQEVARVQPAAASFDQFASTVSKATFREAQGHYNLPEDRLAIQGYDTVSYHRGDPAAGSDQITSKWQDITYRFASAENRALFAADPMKYAPAYGGWCATAMADGDKVVIDPKNYKVTDGRLFLFYKGIWGNAIKDWNKDEAGLTVKADSSWAATSGEKAK
jgi:hypothetical protein